MTRKTVRGIGIVVAAIVLWLPVLASAQSSGIAGVVRDSSGGVLPGVAVEASSPALIEGVRSVVTDESGLYRIIDLRPGAYTVTFVLPGFTTVRREGINLTTGFTADVNAELAVGELAETVLVTGESPVVDVQNVRTQQVISDEVVATLPTGRTIASLGQLIPGISVSEGGRSYADVGGTLGEGTRLSIHGGRPDDGQWLVNGLPSNTFTSTATSNVRLNAGTVEEFSVSTGANPAEYRQGGTVVNMIPKEGGNTYSGMVFGSYANKNMQANNISPELEARGVKKGTGMEYIHDVTAGLGGPIKESKLWFYGSTRYWGVNNLIANVYHDSDLTDFAFTPDLNRPAHDPTWTFDQALRLTWQMSTKHKLQIYAVNQPRKSFGAPLGNSSTGENIPMAEAQVPQNQITNLYDQLGWTAPLSNRVLVEASTGYARSVVDRHAPEEVLPGVIAIVDSGTNISYRAPASNSATKLQTNTARGSMSYVTGTHNFKVGGTWERYHVTATTYLNGPDITYTFLNGVPSRVNQFTTPRTTRVIAGPIAGLYAQDQWTRDRMTINAGLRFDYHRSKVLANELPARRFVGAQSFPEVDNVPNWKDLAPRLGVAYNLFGNGRTALKASFSKYVVSEIRGIANANDPTTTSVNNVNRTWNDLTTFPAGDPRNGNFVPDCNLSDPQINGECGRISNLNFGGSNITTRYDPDLIHGFGKRLINWEMSAGVQHQLMPGVGVNAMYYRRWFKNFTATDNLMVTPANYDPYCITSPRDSRLPDGGGQQICGLFDIQPAVFGLVNNLVTAAKNFPGDEQSEVYDGVDLTMNARLPRGVLIQGGLNTGRTNFTTCQVIDSPQHQYCDNKLPFLTQVKFQGTYMLPWDLQVAATVQSSPGVPIMATYTARNAEILPSLGRNLAAGAAGTTTVELVPQGAIYEDRLFQLDARLSKLFDIGRTRIRGMFDLYNLTNSNTVLFANSQFGPAWQQPLLILGGRLAKFGVQVDF